jgi:hypothetical protein
LLNSGLFCKIVEVDENGKKYEPGNEWKDAKVYNDE